MVPGLVHFRDEHAPEGGQRVAAGPRVRRGPDALALGWGTMAALGRRRHRVRLLDSAQNWPKKTGRTPGARLPGRIPSVAVAATPLQTHGFDTADQFGSVCRAASREGLAECRGRLFDRRTPRRLADVQDQTMEAVHFGGQGLVRISLNSPLWFAGIRHPVSRVLAAFSEAATAADAGRQLIP